MRLEYQPGVALLVFFGSASCCCQALRFQDGLQCTWRQFNSTPILEGVQYLPTQVDHRRFTDFRLHWWGNGHFIASAEANVAMCLIQKVASSNWINAFQSIRHLPLSDDHTTVLGQSNYDDAEAVFANPNSTRIVFVREPLDRLLSGFLDKCSARKANLVRRHRMGGSPYQNHCSLRLSPEQPPGFPFSQVVEWLKAGNSFRDTNPHFSLQASHCELRDRLQEYNVIGLFRHERFSQDSRCVAERAAGLRSLNATAIFRDVKDSENQAKRRTETLKKFYTKEFARLVMDHFEEDYRLFNIPRPTWVDEATGELFDIRPDALEPAHFAAILATEVDTL
uniref:Sulfotransferase domain-containing protein n=1 Tax=Alexandrium andersonii TaxID=327968 RepID=A0A7S2BLB1_9DINO|mmetsp:Transcript_27164/g.61905  ORF Transcript_27164/g.61905 Transcript_27164/m.61905 type:complete len:337 (+) Transcript_27164:77-1087(+)